MYRLLMFVFLFAFMFGCKEQSKGLLLVITNDGWYFNEVYFSQLDKVEKQLKPLINEKLLFSSCPNTEYKRVVESLEMVTKLGFQKLALNSNYRIEPCE